MNPLRSLVNGRVEAQVAVASRLQYGDGVFETIAIQNGQPLLWPEHGRRLAAGAASLGLDAVDPALLGAEAEGLTAGLSLAILKVVLVRGAAGRGYRPAAAPTDRLLSVWPWPSRTRFEEGAPVFWCRTQLARQPLLAGLKHLNRLEQVLAQREFADPYWEGLMQDTQGWVIEGTMTNLFVVERGALATPLLDQAGVAGVMRERVVMRARELGIAVHFDRLTKSRVVEADEVFLCNSIIGVRPVLDLGRGPRRRGPVTAMIEEALRRGGDAVVL